AAPVSPGEGLKAFRAQAKALKAELPAIIADALLAPEEDTATQQAPLTALVFRLGTPLHSLRAVSRGGWLPPPLVRGLKKELGRFK
ncbi:MAG: hypothetical protein GWM98_12055, partial [Nitrospinaceae bacterium]|nr:hypothetical protein [Nitrospinaceae bacterium]NIR55096.1 hypothetical protein [Nitrospinaceae bacterium]NIS85505.1 hypothetical protein [Nitrospinaceae bacterium]NIT82345.1 hypothetical protein [Nitrospinaceae bacterium]NIU44561.1 hypothetical protein [Nitrospinaceae bacterium]